MTENHLLRNAKNQYLILFTILVLPPISVRIGSFFGVFHMPHDVAIGLTAVTKICFVVLTSWYSLKTSMSPFWACLLGLSTMLPFMGLVSLGILLQRRGISDFSNATEGYPRLSYAKFFAGIVLISIAALSAYYNIYVSATKQGFITGRDVIAAFMDFFFSILTIVGIVLVNLSVRKRGGSIPKLVEM